MAPVTRSAASPRRARVHVRSLGVVCLVTLSMAACGNPLVTESYRGAPIWSTEVTLTRGSGVARGAVLRAALFFQPHLDTVDLEQMVELRASGLDVQAPSSMVLNVYEPPGPEQMLRGSDGKELGYAAARLLFYQDDNGDGRREPPEPFLGQMATAAFVFLPRDFAPGEATGRGALSAGFHIVPVPQPCDFMPPPPTTPGDCGVPLGDSCDDDSQCRGGVCLKETKQPFPAGYCVVTRPSATGCRPGAGAYLHAPKYVPLPIEIQGFYGRACATDGDCQRVHPATQVYRCEPTLLACFPPFRGMAVVSRAPLEIEPLCAGGPRFAP